MDNHSTIMILSQFFICLLILSVAEGSLPPKSKRQIYREQVLPSRGGKIPDAAFTSDRLALNRLNKEGISIPDGVLLEHRNVHNHPHINQHDPEDEDSLIKIVQRPEDRYVAPEGKSDKRPLTVSSTYIIRKPIGSESTVLRSPIEQIPLHEALNHQQENQIYQSYPENYFQQAYTPQYDVPEQFSQKYLPAELTAPPQKYLSVEISTSQKYLPVDVTSSSKKYRPTVSSQKYLPDDLSAPPTTVVHHPHPHGLKAPVSYQQVHQSVAYYPITVPLQIPNKSILKNEYYHSKIQGNTYGNHHDTEDIHSVINWPYLLGQYTRLADKINALDRDSYGHSTPHSLFFTPEVLGPIDSGSSYYYATRDRYARKSKEIAVTETILESSKVGLKDGRRLIKVKCSDRLENTVDEGSARCSLRY